MIFHTVKLNLLAMCELILFELEEKLGVQLKLEKNWGLGFFKLRFKIFQSQKIFLYKMCYYEVLVNGKLQWKVIISQK